MASAWYVLQVYSGYENRIEKMIRQSISDASLDKTIVRDVKVPVEQVTEVKEGKKRTQTKKFFPGYILLELDLPTHEWVGVCKQLRELQGVNGFVGTPANKRPMPLTPEEARLILQKSGELKGEKPARARQSFAVGEQIKITEGPFESFTGTIEEVNAEKNKLKVMVGIFGRNTPVEVDIMQVEKIA
ncbi:MAG: transcription termination/antitermination protein NusG [Spirochaetaceae bacterium]|jgi:transcriptional antiterminator NusG|nr:transcription termination/antitermination protein NusG [Spirochaetaceae bacterium]